MGVASITTLVQHLCVVAQTVRVQITVIQVWTPTNAAFTIYSEIAAN